MSATLLPLLRQVSPDRLRADVWHLTRHERSPLSSLSGHTVASHWITAAFERAHLEIRRHSFITSGQEGMNLAGLQMGSITTLPPLLIAAHYDTVLGSPGADDNASGVAALLECARVLSAVRLRRTVEFVAFDLEEVQSAGEGLLGSAAFLRDLGQQQGYAAVINLEMVGYTSGPHTQRFPPGFQFLFPEVHQWVKERDFRGDSLLVVSRQQQGRLGRAFVEGAKTYVPELAVALLEIGEGMPLLSDVFRSDHATFWAAGIPALLLTDTANFRNPHYHTPTDTSDTLDYEFLRRATCSLVAAVASYAEVEL